MPRKSPFQVVQTQSNQNAQKSIINEEIIFMQWYTDTKNEQTEVKCSMNNLCKYNKERKEPNTKYVLCTSVYLQFKDIDTSLAC